MPLAEDLAHEVLLRTLAQGEVEESGTGDVDGGEPGAVVEPVLEDGGHIEGRAPSGASEGQRHIAGVVPAPAGPGPLDLDVPGHVSAVDPQRTVVDRTAHGVQHGEGEVRGGHGTSVWEKGVGTRTGFAMRAGGGGRAHGWAALTDDPSPRWRPTR